MRVVVISLLLLLLVRYLPWVAQAGAASFRQSLTAVARVRCGAVVVCMTP